MAAHSAASGKDSPAGLSPKAESSRSLIFAVRDLTKVYQMGEVPVHALRGVDLDLFESEFVVLLGPSGSGKSTLLNILGGLDTPPRERSAIAIMI